MRFRHKCVKIKKTMSGIGRNEKLFPGFFFSYSIFLTCTIGMRRSLLGFIFKFIFLHDSSCSKTPISMDYARFSGFADFASAVSGIPGLSGTSQLEHFRSSWKIGVTNNIIILPHSVFRNITIMTC